MTKKIIFLMLITVFSLEIFSSTYNLKDKVTVKNDFCYLSDIIEENDHELEKILILKKIDAPIKLSSRQILNILFENKIYNIALIGEEVSIEKNSQAVYNTTCSAMDALKNFLSDKINNKNISLKINIIKTIPQIELYTINENYKWYYPKINDFLKEYKNIKKINIEINKNNYSVEMEVIPLCNVWISDKSFSKDDFLKSDLFFNKNIELSSLSNYDTLIFDIDRFDGFRFMKNIQAGVVLQNSFLKKVPLVIKNEQLKAYYTKNNFLIIVDSISLQDGFENEKIKVKLFNKKEVMGVLKFKDGSKYVEI